MVGVPITVMGLSRVRAAGNNAVAPPVRIMVCARSEVVSMLEFLLWKGNRTLPEEFESCLNLQRRSNCLPGRSIGKYRNDGNMNAQCRSVGVADHECKNSAFLLTFLT
jgi:hypothetical protein